MSQYQTVVGDLLDINTERSPNKRALIDPEKNISFTWSKWKGQVLRFAKQEGLENHQELLTVVFLYSAESNQMLL